MQQVFLCNLCLFYFPDPAFWSLDSSHLNATKFFVEFRKHRAHLLHATRELDRLIMADHLADRADDCSCTTETSLSKIFQLRELDRTMFYRVAQVLCQRNQ